MNFGYGEGGKEQSSKLVYDHGEIKVEKMFDRDRNEILFLRIQCKIICCKPLLGTL